MVNGHTRLTATGNVAAGPSILARVILTAGSDLATAIVYDAASGTTNPIATIKAATNTTHQVQFNITCGRGIQVALTGTAPVCTVIHR